MNRELIRDGEVFRKVMQQHIDRALSEMRQAFARSQAERMEQQIIGTFDGVGPARGHSMPLSRPDKIIIDDPEEEDMELTSPVTGILKAVVFEVNGEQVTLPIQPATHLESEDDFTIVSPEDLDVQPPEMEHEGREYRRVGTTADGDITLYASTEPEPEDTRTRREMETSIERDGANRFYIDVEGQPDEVKEYIQSWLIDVTGEVNEKTEYIQWSDVSYFYVFFQGANYEEGCRCGPVLHRRSQPSAPVVQPNFPSIIAGLNAEYQPREPEWEVGCHTIRLTNCGDILVLNERGAPVDDISFDRLRVIYQEAREKYREWSREERNEPDDDQPF